jgi:hypothetical protein
MRLLAKQQMLGVPVEKINLAIHQDLQSRYAKAGLQDILPDVAFDLRRHQLIPGRRHMIREFKRIERYCSEIVRIDGSAVHLANGQVTEADLVLWGTGYSTDLSYFGINALAGITRLDELTRRCGSMFRSLDAENLFFLAAGVLETSGSTPWAYAHAAKSIASHICGRSVFDSVPVTENVNYFDLAKFLARRDGANYVPILWRLKYLYTSFFHPYNMPMPMP